MTLRDRELTKSELSKLEKKEWGALKNLFFDTDNGVLDYLGNHAERQRLFKRNKLNTRNSTFGELAQVAQFTKKMSKATPTSSNNPKKVISNLLANK